MVPVTADTLRRAAALLRERAGAVGPGLTTPWHAVSHPDGSSFVEYATDHPQAGHIAALADYCYPETADWIATMHPGIGALLADWLDTAGADLRAHGLCCADGCDYCDDDPSQPHIRRALALARALLGEEV